MWLWHISEFPKSNHTWLWHPEKRWVFSRMKHWCTLVLPWARLAVEIAHACSNDSSRAECRQRKSDSRRICLLKRTMMSRECKSNHFQDSPSSFFFFAFLASEMRTWNFLPSIVCCSPASRHLSVASGWLNVRKAKWPWEKQWALEQTSRYRPRTLKSHSFSGPNVSK